MKGDFRCSVQMAMANKKASSAQNVAPSWWQHQKQTRRNLLKFPAICPAQDADTS